MAIENLNPASPLTNEELTQHVLHAQMNDPRVESPGDPSTPGAQGIFNPGNLQHTSYEHLRGIIERTDEQLVEDVEGFGHRPSQESLERGLKDLRDLTERKLKDVNTAMGSGDIIGTVNEYLETEYEGTGEKPPVEAVDPNRPIGLSDVMMYLDAKQAEHRARLTAIEGGRGLPALALHQASTDLLQSMVMQWQYNNPAAREAYQNGERLSLEFDSPHNDTLFNDLRERHRAFEGLTKEKIRNLGEDALDAADVRRRLSQTQVDEATHGRGEAGESEHATVQQESYAADSQVAEQASRAERLFRDIVALGEGKTQLYTDISGGYSFIGDGPEIEKKVAFMPDDVIKDIARDVNAEGLDWKSQPNEVVSFTKLVDREEPTTRFRYRFSFTMQSRMDGDPPSYQEFKGGREGQQIMLGLDLPESVATELQNQVEADPASVRTLVEQLFLARNDGSITKDYWQHGSESGHPIRPPYEQLSAGWEVTVIKGDERTTGVAQGDDGFIRRRRGDDGTLRHAYDVERLPRAS